MLEDADKKAFDSNLIDLVVVDKGETFTDLSDVSSFKGFLDRVFYYDKFKKYYILDEEEPTLEQEFLDEVTFTDLLVKEIEVKSNEIKTFRASKQISLDASKVNLDFGNEIHFLMEIVDFKNPDYQIINNKLHQEIIERFLSSDLMKDVRLGDVYKEYQFYLLY